MSRRSLTQCRAKLAFQQSQNVSHVFVRLGGSETAVICPERQVEGHALFARGDACTGVDIEQGDLLQQALCAAADAVFQCAHGNACVANHGDVPRHGREFGKCMIAVSYTHLLADSGGFGDSERQRNLFFKKE